MAAPASEDLLIIVNGQTVTDLIPADSITIVNERGKRVSSCALTIQDGAALGIAQWQSLLVYSTDLATVHFNGFIMSYNTVKRGIYIDYTLDCSSVEILLQKATINGSFTGDDADILGAILANAYPDLSDFFDWAGDITPLSLSDLQMDFQDLNLMEALEALSAKVGGAPYNQGYNDNTGINMIKNPNINASMNYYGGTLATGSFWDNSFPTWNSGNVAWDAGFGESGTGGIRVTSQDFSGTHHGFLRIGRENDSAALPFRIDAPSELWLAHSMRFKMTTATGSFAIRFRLVTYDIEGVLFHDGSNTVLTTAGADSGSPGGWQTRKSAASFTWGNGAFDPYGADEIPSGGYCEFELQVTSSLPFTFDIDKFIVEVLPPAASPPNFPPTTGMFTAYFDGNSSGAYWLGVSNASASSTAANPLKWGTSPDAAFDVDIGNMDELISDFQYDFNGFDGINSVIVTGGFQYEDVDWEYPAHGNAANTHFDLEVPVYAADTFEFPIIYKNTGSDESPNWVTQTVGTRDDAFQTKNTLYDLEGHWVEFSEAPAALDRSFRIVGRIKNRIRAIVQNESNIASTGLEMGSVLNIDTVSTPSQAFDLGQAELANRAPGATMRFTTYEPGLLAGDEIDIADDLQSLDETTIIERVTRNYLRGGKGKFLIEAGKYQSGLDDVLAETHYIATPRVPLDENAVELALRILTDDDEGELTDDNGLLLADIA